MLVYQPIVDSALIPGAKEAVLVRSLEKGKLVPGTSALPSGSEAPSADLALTVPTLGPVAVRWNQRALAGTSLRNTESLLIYLALNPGKQHRSHLAGLPWGDLSEGRARANLRHALWDLRCRLDPSAFHIDRGSVGLGPGILCRVDALDFAARVDRAARCRRAREFLVTVEHLVFWRL